MRAQALKDEVKISACTLNAETLEIVERVCHGSIKGTKLPRSERSVDFYQDDREYRIEQGEYLVQFVSGKGVFFQVWSAKRFHEVFKDVDPITY